MGMLIPILHSAVTIMTPLLLAASGGLFTELAGMLNIALEGLLLIGAFTAIVCTHLSGSLLIGTIAGIFSSVALAGILGGITLKLKCNVFITGLAANLFASGLTVILSYRFFGTRGVLAPRDIPRLTPVNIPNLAHIPILGNVFMGYTWFTYCSWLLLVLCWFTLYRTPFGFRVRACAGHTEALSSLGLKSDTYQFIAFLISGFTCGIGGAFLSLNLGVFVPNLSAGKGWIALVVIFLGNRTPLGLCIAALVFGFAEAFSNYAQGSFNIPTDFILAIPYIFTLFVMAGVSMYTNRKGGIF
jgi:simple sugar transport system permease protein